MVCVQAPGVVADGDAVDHGVGAWVDPDQEVVLGHGDPDRAPAGGDEGESDPVQSAGPDPDAGEPLAGAAVQAHQPLPVGNGCPDGAAADVDIEDIGQGELACHPASDAPLAGSQIVLQIVVQIVGVPAAGDAGASTGLAGERVVGPGCR